MSDTISPQEGIHPLIQATNHPERNSAVDHDPQRAVKEKEHIAFEAYITAPLKIVEPFEKCQVEKEEGDKEKEEDSPTKSAEIEGTTAKAKKSVSFNPNDEEIRKFTTGEPIVDQINPFRNGSVATGHNKKTPPPVPTKRSTLSVRKTVTQQMREREREKEKEKQKEKEREQQKNDSNNRRNRAFQSHQADDYVTTEEVLKQSKYVKTYIKNPDAVFVYDPTVLARLKFEELQELTGKLPKRKQPPKEPRNQGNKQPRHQPQKHLEQPTFKKCSKPNYPELANLKIRTGTHSDPEISSALLNPAEVTKNARKFDERVKKLQITSDDDLDEIDGPLTKSESSDDLVTSSSVPPSPLKPAMSGNAVEPSLGTFTNTVSSEEFQAYLDRKGLALMPRREMASPSTARSSPQVRFGSATAEERRQQVAESLAALRKSNTKKLSVLQRLSNSLFPARRKTTPKLEGPLPRRLFHENEEKKEELHRKDEPPEIRRILLERQNQVAQEQTPVSVATLQRSTLERRGLSPRRKWPEAQLGRISRSTSVDRSQFLEQSIPTSPVATSTPVRGQNQWDHLRAIKEVTDRQLYHKLHQQQQLQVRQSKGEDIYSQVVVQPEQVGFVRGSLQRNTFSGVTSGRHNRQMVVLNDTPMRQVQPPRCQSVMDNLVPGGGQQPGMHHANGTPTPVVMRQRVEHGQARRIGGLLTREEILEKVKEFCRKSITRTPLPESKAQMQMQPFYKRHLTPPNADVSPVSYASVDDQCARPQVPHRVQSLPVSQGNYIPGGNALGGASPIYAHVSKRNSLLSNVSEQYLSSQQLGTLTRPVPLNQLVLVDTGAGVQVAQLVDYLPYVRPAPVQSQSYLMQDGRATPLILDHSAQQDSQIYWTPQHRQRISHPIQTPRFIKAMPSSRNSTISRHLEARMGNGNGNASD
ncbi:uncharacterized protein LOC108140340 isoform X1 [Drosophila elegans]|uniref:uncharacterized protein LOC108140340 isoform X1 n=1 Tax=Drosophila elegans TaxID=30023 RepID=UPI0007E7DB27|nr:uncharacterized protein LOC108140340 isoform X1 [Drosophila elegans]XP_041564372.1 uncharacterized protein LOC108140340 isoform X1 [Drosophila elegans]